MTEREELPWLGDGMAWFIVKSMLDLSQPVFASDSGSSDRDWPKQRLTITSLGRAVLAGELDFLSLRPPVRWLGAARIDGVAACWRWEDTAGEIVQIKRPLK